jgi:predicted ATPase
MYITEIEIQSDRYPTEGCYPFNVPTLREPQKLSLDRPVVFFVGENGSGKSTLLEALCRKCGIHIWDKPKRHIAHQNPYESRLSDYIDVTWANGRVAGSLFRAETFREFADFIDDISLCDPGRLKYHGGRILNVLSHGQGILSYLATRYQIKGLYFLDEPEAALSPASQIKFLRLLQGLSAQGHAQFIVATHSPILLALPDAQIYCFDPPQIREIAYTDTEHYRLYKRFLADPGAYLASAAQACAEQRSATPPTARKEDPNSQQRLTVRDIHWSSSNHHEGEI